MQVISEFDMFLGKKTRSLSACYFPIPCVRPEQGFVVFTVLSLLDNDKGEDKDNCLLLQRTKHSK